MIARPTQLWQYESYQYAREEAMLSRTSLVLLLVAVAARRASRQLR